jgi:hypothetical protein
MPPAIARAALETLLRTRKLDSTLTTALPLAPEQDDVIATGMAALDAHLLGGLPRGQLSEVIGPRSSGRTSLLQTALADVTRGGELVALIDTLDRWDPAGLAERGGDLTRLLWVRGRDVPLSQLSLAPEWEPSRPVPGGRRRSHVAHALDRAVKALTLVLNAGGFGLVVLDVADVPLLVLRELPFTTWMRLHRVLEGSSTACVLIGDEPLARSAGGLSIRLEPLPEVRGREPRPMSFDAEVRASRRPFIGRRAPRASAGRWVGSLPARRLSGLAGEASVVRAHRSLQTTDRVALSFGK